MSRRGHETGIISTYFHTWLLKTDKKGCVLITPAVRHDQVGTSTKVSATEVRQVDVTSQPGAGQLVSRTCHDVCESVFVCARA